jgi:FtsZ-interacting cell division protein ZipA
LRAGFTQREISTQKVKFYNLMSVRPCYTHELQMFDQMMQDRRMLLDALQFVVTDPCFKVLGSVTQENVHAAIAKATGHEKTI